MKERKIFMDMAKQLAILMIVALSGHCDLLAQTGLPNKVKKQKWEKASSLPKMTNDSLQIAQYQQWYQRQPDLVQFFVYAKNGQKRVTPKNIMQLLPLETVDLSPYSHLQNVDVIKELKSLKSLRLGQFINNFAGLQLPDLEILDLTFSPIGNNDLQQINAPKLKIINLSGTRITNLEMLPILFPKLQQIIVMEGQLPKPQMLELASKHPNLSIKYHPILKPISRHLRADEFEPYLEWLPLPQVLRKAKIRKFNIELTIDVESGKVLQAKPTGRASGRASAQYLAQSLQNMLLFDKAQNAQKRQFVLLPIRLNKRGKTQYDKP